MATQGSGQGQGPGHKHPLDNLTYNFITVMQNKSEALLAYDKYIQDARAANSQECVAFFERIHQEDSRQVEEAKRHLTMILNGKMGQGGQGQR